MAHYMPALLAHVRTLPRNEAIAAYYHYGYTVNEIIGFLALQHGIVVSERHVHRILRSMNLYRQNNQSPLEDIIVAVLRELSSSGENAGYRQMRQRLLLNHQLIATSELVRLVLSVGDPAGVSARRARRLQRRIYTNRGPNYAIHFDGCEKLKPFGISVHGAIDGYTRRILWLHGCNSNKKPEYIAKCYIDYIKQVNGIPVRVYGDREQRMLLYVISSMYCAGMTKTHFKDSQVLFMYDQTEMLELNDFGEVCVRCVELLGSTISKTCVIWVCWIRLANIHLECMRFCFLRLINDDLLNVSSLWNQHRVREQHSMQSAHQESQMFYIFSQSCLVGGIIRSHCQMIFKQ